MSPLPRAIQTHPCISRLGCLPDLLHPVQQVLVRIGCHIKGQARHGGHANGEDEEAVVLPLGADGCVGRGSRGQGHKQRLSQVLHTTEGGRERTDTEGLSWLPRDSSSKRRSFRFWSLEATDGAQEVIGEDAECILRVLRSLMSLW